MERFKFVMSELWRFLEPFVKILLSQGGKILAKAAMDAVESASKMGGASNEEKRKAAFEQIQQKLTAQGIEMAVSVINAALEAAVVKFKKK